MNVSPIGDPLPGEQVIATDPTLAPAVDAGWRRRLHVYTGRALSNIALMTEQSERGGRLATHGQVISSGVVSGLEVGVERVEVAAGPQTPEAVQPAIPPIHPNVQYFYHIAAGTGITAGGEDVVVPRAMRVNMQDVRVYAPVSVLHPSSTGSSDLAGTLAARTLDGPLGAVLARGVTLPAVAILVLQPIVAELLDVPNSTDPCAQDAGDDAFNDWQLVDGCRLVMYCWPEEWLSLPALDTRGRNRLAYTLFEAEARVTDPLSPWAAPDLPMLPLPWMELGVPIALVAFDPSWVPLWVDRYSVVRQGGRMRGHRPWPAGAGTPALWEARLQQFAEQMADPALAGTQGAALAQQFRYLPPVGILPKDLIDVRAGQDSFFPPYYSTSGRPVPLEQLDVVTEAAAALAPLDLFSADQVEVLVPVPQIWYEPDLLVTETVDPTFQQTIDGFTVERWQWLQRRADVRSKASAIGQAITGTAPTYPTPDPDALDDESSAPPMPFAGNLVHLSLPTVGYHAHSFSGATTTLDPAVGDMLFAYVYPDPDHLPDAVMLAWSPNNEDWQHGAVWGTLPPTDGAPPFNARSMGPLPPPGQWTRLEVPAGLVNVANTTLTCMAFTLFNGSAAWGRAGKSTPELTATPADVLWLDIAVPAGAGATPTPVVPSEDWNWSDLTVQPFPVEDNFQTTGSNAVRTVAPLETLKTNLATILQPAEITPLDAEGLQRFLTDLQGRIKQSDDAVDFGFVRVQTDIYRMRQLMLGNLEATRLATSPALATIAQGESAVATREDLNTYFTAAKGAIPQTTVSSVSAGTLDSSVTGGAAASVPAASAPLGDAGGGDGGPIDTGTGGRFHQAAGFNAASRIISTQRFTAGSLPFRTTVSSGLAASQVSGTIMMKPASLAESVVTPATSIQPSVQFTTVTQPEATVQFTPSVAVAAAVPITSMLRVASTQTVPTLHSSVAARTIDVVEQSPIVGAGYDFRSVTVAQRLDDPKAPEARSFTVASKFDVINSLKDIPINIDTVTIAGVATFKPSADGQRTEPAYDAHGQPIREPIQFKDLTNDSLTRILNDPDPLNADEAGFFAAGILNLDHTISTLRGVEGRIQSYRSAVEICTQALATLQGIAPQIDARLAAIGAGLTETRSNISVARALLADETVRVNALNQQRDAVLAEHVAFLAYRRPRVSDVLLAAPGRFLDPGLAQAPGPACLNQAVVIPPELRALVDLLHEAPVRWYTHIPVLVDRFDRLDTMQDVLGNAKLRAGFNLSPRHAFLPSLAAPSLLGSAITGVLTAHRQVVTQARLPVAQLDLSGAGTQSWQNLRDRARDILSLGDLIDGGHGRSDVSQDAAAELDQIAHVAGCLYGAVGAVLPAIRLVWAERLSQFEASVNLRNLSSLPRWGELAGIDRQEMQGLVDWLYQRVDVFQPDAVSIMNDLVRVCILLASHAPVNEIIAGQVAQATTVQPGGRITLNIDPVRVRVGMQVLMYSGSDVVARGVVEDLTAGQAAARVVQAAAPTVQLSRGATVHFADTNALAGLPVTTSLNRMRLT